MAAVSAPGAATHGAWHRAIIGEGEQHQLTRVVAELQEDKERQLTRVVAEIHDVERAISKLQDELAQQNKRREALAQEEQTLRQELGQLVPSAQAALSPGAEVSGPSTEAPRASEPVGSAEPVFFVMGHDREDSLEGLEGGATAKELMAPESSAKATASQTVASRETGASRKGEAASPKACPIEDDWERALDSVGVANCGVCGMKLPLDVVAIEKHCLECEGPSKEGRTRSKSDIKFATIGGAPVDRANSLRNKLAARAPK